MKTAGLSDADAAKRLYLTGGSFTWIEEKARHLGHLDLLREIFDGATVEWRGRRLLSPLSPLRRSRRV